MVFLSGSKYVQGFLIICLYMYYRWISSYQDWDPINRLNPATFSVSPEPGPWISTSRVVVFCVKMRDDCSSCWYLWNFLTCLSYALETMSDMSLVLTYYSVDYFKQNLLNQTIKGWHPVFVHVSKHIFFNTMSGSPK